MRRYKEAGVSPSDSIVIDLFQFYSCFSAQPTDFDFLAVIGKGTFGKVKKKKKCIYLLCLPVCPAVNSRFSVANHWGQVVTSRGPSVIVIYILPGLLTPHNL